MKKIRNWLVENKTWLAKNMTWCGIACGVGMFFAVITHLVPINLLEAVWYGMTGGQFALAAAKTASALCAVGCFAIAGYGQVLWMLTCLTETLGARASSR